MGEKRSKPDLGRIHGVAKPTRRAIQLKYKRLTAKADKLKNLIADRFHTEFREYALSKRALRQCKHRKSIEAFVLKHISPNSKEAGKQIEEEMDFIRQKIQKAVNVLGRGNIGIDMNRFWVLVHDHEAIWEKKHFVFMEFDLVSRVETTPDGSSNFYDL